MGSIPRNSRNNLQNAKSALNVLKVRSNNLSSVYNLASAWIELVKILCQESGIQQCQCWNQNSLQLGKRETSPQDGDNTRIQKWLCMEKRKQRLWKWLLYLVFEAGMSENPCQLRDNASGGSKTQSAKPISFWSSGSARHGRHFTLRNMSVVLRKLC